MSVDNDRTTQPDPFGLGIRDSQTLIAQAWWTVALRGALAILFGVIAVLMPAVTLASLVLLFAAYMLVDGVLAVASAVRAVRRHQRWGWLILEGVADLAAAAVAVLWPAVTIFVAVVMMGAWAVVSGAFLLVAAFGLHPAYGRWAMGLGGGASILWGLLLLLWPAAGALVLTWWLGLYALVFGSALLVLAVRLRRRHHDGVRLQAAPAPS